MVGANVSMINNNMNQLSKTNPELAGILGLSIIIVSIITLIIIFKKGD